MGYDSNQYDAIIIGYGKGGKTLAAALGAAGKRTALIEQSPLMYGGTCVNVGCIPTKYLVQKARQAAKVDRSFAEQAAFYRDAIAGKNALTKMLREKNFTKLSSTPNVTIITGKARLTSPHQVHVDTEDGSLSLEGAQIFLNTGSHPYLPPIPGLQGNPHAYTSEGLLSLEDLPRRLVIIGGGYIGMEFASIYTDFGSRVTVLQDGERFLPREDDQIAEAVRENLSKRGVKILTGIQLKMIMNGSDHALLSLLLEGEEIHIEADAVLVATGRRPNTEDLGLEAAGVALTPRGGIQVDDTLRTSVPHIYAMGDVIGGLQFTYLSLDDYRIVQSALLGDGSYTLRERGAVPYSVFLNPPFSRVGLSEAEAVKQGYQVRIASLPAAAIPKAQVVEQPSGLLKAVIDARTGQILGAHLFCEESHEMINLVKLAMDARLPYTVLRDMIYTHPTMSEAFNDLFTI